MFSSWHIVIGGYRQRTGELGGMERLWLELCPLQSDTCCVHFYEWNQDWPAIANLIARSSINGTGPRIHVYAFSWGAGYGCRQLARELGDRGLRIRYAVLCDPVYRSLLFCTRWLAYVPWVPITIPANVDEVCGVRQTKSLLRGHSLLAANPRATKIRPLEERPRTHVWMDDDPYYHSICKRIAGLSQGPNPNDQ